MRIWAVTTDHPAIRMPRLVPEVESKSNGLFSLLDRALLTPPLRGMGFPLPLAG